MSSKVSKWLSFKPWDRHGGILVLAGLTYILIGHVYIFDPQPQSEVDVMYFALRLMPFDWWGFGFIIVGTTAILSARWPNWHKAWGYSVLTGWSSAWSAFFFAGAILTDAEIVYISTGAMWALMAILWWGVSGMVSPSKDEGGR